MPVQLVTKYGDVSPAVVCRMSGRPCVMKQRVAFELADLLLELNPREMKKYVHAETYLQESIVLSSVAHKQRQPRGPLHVNRKAINIIDP